MKRPIAFLASIILALWGPAMALATEETTQAPVQEEYHTEYYGQEPESNAYEGWPQGPLVEGRAAILMDLDTDAILYAKNIDEELYPASITKLMTGLLVCENLDDTGSFEMSEAAAYGIEAGSSSIYADTGEVFTIEQGLMALMLESANEMALRFGELVSGSVKKFVELMNQRARELTCTHTHFNNPHGLPDPTHYTSARDMAKIAKAAWQNLTFRKYYTNGYYEIPPTNVMKETRYMINNHRMMEDREYAYNGVMGGKTGYTDDAGNTLVTFARQGDLTLVVVVLGSIGGAYADTTALLNYGFEEFEHLDMGIDEEAPVEMLPAQQAISPGSAFPYRKGVMVTVPIGTGRKAIERRQSLLENVAGPRRIKSKYYLGGQMVGYGMQYESLLSSEG